MRRVVCISVALFLDLAIAGASQSARAQGPLSADLMQKIDQLAADTLSKTEVPSASIGVVKNGQIVYLHAYGSARLDPPTPAAPAMRYSIGSISKQFTAAALLLLQERGKLSIDDKVGKFLPDLTRSKEVSIRQLLSHTSGYQDYWPQDYVMPMMLQPTTPRKILDLWARKPLDFEPGTKWQYSNTNYMIAGLIVEKVSGVPLLQFLEQSIFAPLGMKSAFDVDQTKLGAGDPMGYMRYGLGPARPAPKEGRGWLFAAGELAFTAEDLSKWDISIIDRSLLKPSSYSAFENEILLKNGLGSNYGLGVFVGSRFGHRALAHGGEVSGYTSENIVFPDDRAAIAVLTNQDAGDAAEAIANGIVPLLLAPDDPTGPPNLAGARMIFDGLQHGTIDRSLFTENANFYFSDQALKDFSSTLGPLGTPQEFTEINEALRGGMKFRGYSVKFANTSFRVWVYEMPDGKLEEYQVVPQE